MTIDYLAIFNSKPILDRIYINSTFGKLRFAVKKNLRYLNPYWEDISEWLMADALDNKWDTEKPLPIDNAAFVERLETFLKENQVEVSPFLIDESYLKDVDVISGADENIISWLIKPEE